MHIKQEINAQNLRPQKECLTRPQVSGVQSGVTKRVYIPIYEPCSAFRL